MLSIAYIFLSTKRLFWKITRISCLFFLIHSNNEQQVRGQANVCVFHQMFGGGSSWRQGDYILPLHPALCTPVTQGNQFLGGIGPFSRLNETNFSLISFNFHLETKMTLVYKESLTWFNEFNKLLKHFLSVSESFDYAFQQFLICFLRDVPGLS